MKLYLLSLTLIFTGNLAFGQQHKDEILLKKAKEIHENVITIDTHADININNFTKDRNYSMALENQVTLPKMEAGGLDVAWFIVYTGQDKLTDEGYRNAYQNAMSKFKAIHKLVNDFAPNQIGLATNSKEVRNLISEGKKVAMIGVENGYSIGKDIENVEKFYDLGARYMSLAHQGHSQLSDSNTGEENQDWLHNGLSDLGKKVIVEMNRLGMMIDVSHPSKKAIKQMFELSKAPLIASHSSARQLCDHSRNLDDELLLLFKKHGGVVQTVAFSAYVNNQKNKAFEEASAIIYNKKAEEMNFEILPDDTLRTLSNIDRNRYYAKHHQVKTAAIPEIELLKQKIEPVDVADFVDHIDYMVNLIGIEHVGISSDFDGGGGIEGWQDASQTLNITKELVKRGYSRDEIAKLWGENLLRVMNEVNDVATKLQKA
ncbi:membrane dipeptidase/D-alanyl-D-alanine dipeptidase [Salegentibacter sp. 24]|jgi:membrane dipeptidase/D-alanyl-D-alanine dipeptidase|uniref:dipeptidase n=1 Tax=Salegentibacter sp. 24 TaxID=2183986 RepID=UPI001061C83C|nr:dipeptidase [Salegentibacter sp. 24]TDN85888.1 membrane dipeptidase/D-alanyl-D-alanine dipeptidase [Salegentibacter sp. 24]